MKSVDQYLNKFPDDEKFLGFENVSTPCTPMINYFLVAFKHLLRKFSSASAFSLYSFQRAGVALETLQQRQKLFDK
jgi:hypothetical protein